jgi:hypothetical protein
MKTIANSAQADVSGNSSQGIARFVVAIIFATTLLFALNTTTSTSAFAGSVAPKTIALAPAKTFELVDQNQQNQQNQNPGSTGAAGEAQAYSQQDLLDAQTNHAGTTIQDAAVPMAALDLDGFHSYSASQKSDGSIVNTAIAIFCSISMILLMGALTRKKRISFRVLTARTLAVAIGLVTVSTWSLFDKLAVPAMWFNDTSAMIVAMFVAYLVVAATSIVIEVVIDKHSKVTK